MTETDIPWKRFWYPRDTEASLDPEGFLADPEHEWAKYSPTGLVHSTETFADRCVIFLGEPSSGKSKTLGPEGSDRQQIETAIQNAKSVAVWLDLRDYDSSQDLTNTFKNHETIARWRATERQKLFLFMDSLDECRASIPAISNVVARELAELPLDRLMLRIICRTAEWPTFFESELRRLYKQEPRILQLAPLRRRDVQMAAQHLGVDAKAFLQRIEELNAVPFARKPFTLVHLLRVFSRNEPLPDTQWDLYEQCCLIDCEEYNRSRIAAHKTRQFIAQQLMEVTSRLAAVSVLSNIAEFTYEPDAKAGGPRSLQSSDLIGYEEACAGIPFDVTKDVVAQAFETAMFAASGPGKLRWATRSVAEFLTARYLLCSRQLSLVNILNLIVHPRDSRQRLVPQLNNTSAWLAERCDDVFKHIVRRQADLLIGALDPGSFTDARRLLLTNELLAQASVSSFSFRFGTRRLLSRLKCQGISDVLRATLSDPKAVIESKIRAAEIALACQCTEVVDLLSQAALVADTPGPLRTLGVLAVAQLGDTTARSKMRKLVDDGTVSRWEDDELLGAVLMALWPDHLSFAEMLALKTPPRSPNTINVYTQFVRDFIPERLPACDLPRALDWVAGISERGSWEPDRECAAKLFVLGLRRIFEGPIREKLGEIAYRRLRAYEELIPFTASARSVEFRARLNEEDEARRTLVREILPRIEDAHTGGWAFLFTEGMVRKGDLQWLLKLGGTSKSADVRYCCWSLAVRVFRFTADDVEALYAAAQEWPELRKMSSFILDPVELDSQIARDQRSEYESVRQRQEGKLQEDQLNSALASMRQLIRRSETDVWVNIAYLLESAGSPAGSGGRRGPLSGSRAWLSLTFVEKDACIQAARRYVNAGDPRNEDWFGTTSWPYYAVAGYHALILLLQLDAKFVNSLSPATWARWIPVVLTLLREGTAQHADELVRKGYGANPDDFLAQLKRRVRTEAKESPHLSVLGNIEHVWDAAVEGALCEVLRNGSLDGAAIGSLLRSLLQHKSTVALEFALSLLREPVSQRGRSETAISAAEALIDVNPKEAWETLWPIFMQEEAVGKRIIEGTAYRNFGNSPLLMALSERQLAQLFRWMLKHYPIRRGEGLGFGAVSPAFAAARLRDSLPQRLATYGSYEALRMLNAMQKEVPEFPWVYYLNQGDERAREATWEPPSPSEVIEVTRRSEARFVSNADQLMSVVMEALERIHFELHAETPAVEELWNYTQGEKTDRRRVKAKGKGRRRTQARELRKRVWSPKDEGHVSNWLKRRLQDVIRTPGIVIGREVEIRSSAVSSGERTDLYITAAKPDGTDKLVVVVEVKGCWHRGLKTAMKTQLVERYLKQNLYAHGIYVVAWFLCPRWDAKDSRRRDVRFADTNKARSYLSAQAAKLSNDEVHVSAFLLDAALR